MNLVLRISYIFATPTVIPVNKRMENIQSLMPALFLRGTHRVGQRSPSHTFYPNAENWGNQKNYKLLPVVKFEILCRENGENVCFQYYQTFSD